MNKYKVISLVLAVALLASLSRLVYVSGQAGQSGTPDRSAAVLANIHSRKSVRAYTAQPVRRSQLDTLVKAAMAAPSGRDMRPWQFVVVDDKAVMDSLASQLPYAKMLTQAQAAIVVCGDLSVKDDKGNPSTNWPFDCSAATENLLLAAESMGLGAVWTGVHPYPERVAAVRQALALPDEIEPFCLVPIGWPEGDPQPKDKYNPERIHYNGW